MKTTFKEIAHKSPEWTNAVKLREKILREPLGSIFTDRELEEEKYHFHIAGFIDDTIIATAVLVPEGDVMKMQRVVVTETLRGMNIGSEMMAFCEKFAIDRKSKFNILSRPRLSCKLFISKMGTKKLETISMKMEYHI